MKSLTLLGTIALATALAGCGSGEVDPNPYGLTGVNADGKGQAVPGQLNGGPGQPSQGGMPVGYPAPKNQAPAAADAPKADGDQPKVEGSVTLSTEEIDQIKKLPEPEQAQALAQKVCPISGENLGAMGMPIKVTAGEKTAYLCCKGCTEDFDKDPQAALAKLEKK